MKSRDEILSTLIRLKPSLESKYKIKKIGLFGSYSRGDQTAHSDVDVLVEVDPSIGLNFVTLADTIEKELGVKTDVVSLRGIKPRYFSVIETEIIYV